MMQDLIIRLGKLSRYDFHHLFNFGRGFFQLAILHSFHQFISLLICDFSLEKTDSMGLRNELYSGRWMHFLWHVSMDWCIVTNKIILMSRFMFCLNEFCSPCYMIPFLVSNGWHLYRQSQLTNWFWGHDYLAVLCWDARLLYSRLLWWHTLKEHSSISIWSDPLHPPSKTFSTYSTREFLTRGSICYPQILGTPWSSWTAYVGNSQ